MMEVLIDEVISSRFILFQHIYAQFATEFIVMNSLNVHVFMVD